MSDSVESRMAVLIESIRSLSAITANHDILLTKLIDDHEQRIRLLEKCLSDNNKIPDLEKRTRDLENWRWYIIGIAVGLSSVISVAMVAI